MHPDAIHINESSWWLWFCAIESTGAIRRIRIIIENKPARPAPSDAAILLVFLLPFFCEGFFQTIMTQAHC